MTSLLLNQITFVFLLIIHFLIILMKKTTLLIAACFLAVMAYAAGGNITYELNGGVTNDHGWSNKQDMYEGLNAAWNTFKGATEVWPTLESLITTWGSAEEAVPKGIPTHTSSMEVPFIQDATVKAEWQWLVDYMDAACAADGKGLASATGAALRYNFSAFFFSSVRPGWPASPSYAVLGQPVEFIPSWGHAFAGPSTYDGTTEVIIPDPYKEDATFDGWYENADFSGAEVTSIAVGEEGDKTLYAKWVEYIPTCEEVRALGAGETSKTAGVVTFIDGTTAYIQDETTGLKIEFTAAPDIQLGDEITLTGTTAALGAYIEVIDATVLAKETATLPAIQAITLTALNTNTAGYMFEYVSIENIQIVSYGTGSVTLKDNAENEITLLTTLDQSEFPVNKRVDIEAAVVSYDTDVVLVTDPAKVTTTSSTEMSGVYTVGTTAGADFATFKLAATAINSATITGDVVLEITSDLEEPNNIGLVFNSEFTLTIRPDADEDRTITFDHAADDNAGPSGGLCIGVGTSIAWADITATKNITIDGYAVGGTTRRLKIATAATHNSGNMPILLLDDCSNINIKNCIIENVGSSTGSSAYSIYLRVDGRFGTKKMPSNVTIENNIITTTKSTASQAIGIYASAAPTTPATGIVIKDNVISATTRGLFLNDTESLVFTGNEVRVNQPGSGMLSHGIMGFTRVSGDLTIDGNKFIELTTANIAAGNGIRHITASGGGTWNITNNFFTGFGATGASGVGELTAIRVGSPCFINNNTFLLNTLDADANHKPSYQGILIAAETPEIQNNILISTEDAVTNTLISGTNGGDSDNNVFYFAETNAKAFINGTYATLESYLTGSGKDANSKFANVEFADAAAGDLTIAGASIKDKNLEVPRLSSVLFDILGKERAEFTYAGAHESLLPFLSVFVEGVETTARIMTTATGVQVEVDGEANIELYNLNGQLLDKARVNGSYSRDLSSGVYIIRINGKATKFIK